MKLKTRLIRWLKLRSWGVALEEDLPPEFIITTHGQKRLVERLGLKGEEAKWHILNVWYSKEQLPAGFKPDSAYRDPFIKKYEYRAWSNDVYVFGIRKGANKNWPTIKYFITLYKFI